MKDNAMLEMRLVKLSEQIGQLNHAVSKLQSEIEILKNESDWIKKTFVGDGR